MGNVLSIAAVTETLVNLLTANIAAAGVTGAQVTAFPPDQPNKMPNPGVNVYLYQVTPNKAFRNADLPTRAVDGTLLRKPQVALDLHYLFTFYGDETSLEQQRLLGAVSLALHAHPRLDRAMIKAAETGATFLNTANLDSQSELIRFVPIVFSLEELSKLWSFLLKIDYVLSTAYMASVVLIETDDAVPPPALPVLSTGVSVQPMRQPVITAVVVKSDPTLPVTAGAEVLIQGRYLASPSGGAVEVTIAGAAAPTSSVADASIDLTLPAVLAAGTQTVQVLQPLSLGNPATPHAGTGNASAGFPFVLAPMIASGPGTLTYNPAGPSIAVKVIPTAKKGQRAYLQLSPSGAPTASQLFDGGALAADSDTLVIPTPGLAAGTYIARVLIDGAFSPYQMSGGVPVGPTVPVV